MRVIALLIAVAAVSACSSQPKRLDAAPTEVEIYDPYENMNRRALAANRVVDDLYIRPIAGIYERFLPKPVRTSAGNFTENILTPSYAFNDALQADFEDAGHNVARLTVNTTLGVGGLFDVASRMGLESRPEDLGQTLGNWGVPQGPYFIAPVVGPTTARGVLGSLARIGISPVTLFIMPESLAFRGGMVTQRTAQKRLEGDSTLTEVYYEDDGYILLRSLYLQEQAAALYEDGDPYENLPDFDFVD